MGGHGYFGWMGGFGAMGGLGGRGQIGGSVGWCIKWPCDISLERVCCHLCHGMDLGRP